MSVSVLFSLPKLLKIVKDVRVYATHMLISQFASFMDSRKILDSLESETKDFITHSNSSSQKNQCLLLFSKPQVPQGNSKRAR